MAKRSSTVAFPRPEMALRVRPTFLGFSVGDTPMILRKSVSFSLPPGFAHAQQGWAQQLPHYQWYATIGVATSLIHSLSVSE
jgi:hypothetical protein